MQVYTLQYAEDLRDIAEVWKSQVNWQEFGLVAEMDEFLVDIQSVIDGDGVVFILADSGIIGFLGIRVTKSPVSQQLFANEHYWYVKPENRGIGSLRLINAAKEWAILRGCSHLLLSVSTLSAGGIELNDKICKLYERMGAKKLETTFLLPL